MTDTAPQVQVTAVEAPESGDVLAAAAVDAATLSGAAAATAAEAGNKAEGASAQATQAQGTASAALTEAASKPDTAEVERIADERVDKLVAALRETQAPAEPVVATATVEAPPAKDEPPANVKKGTVKRRTFAQRYMGAE